MTLTTSAMKSVGSPRANSGATARPVISQATPIKSTLKAFRKSSMRTAVGEVLPIRTTQLLSLRTLAQLRAQTLRGS
ncbi:hypothetical protein [Acidovorax sp. MR-S7]|uniref:hypothetical protein n=1 Tax=Acidovorax sp. MR-S7 TaxID=1268622 RepID=UPI0019076D87|nr:hypothetical protein [Acidovorax sp. MR-S7]